MIVTSPQRHLTPSETTGPIGRLDQHWDTDFLRGKAPNPLLYYLKSFIKSQFLF